MTGDWVYSRIALLLYTGAVVEPGFPELQL
jgi:hypothetical protein